MLSSQEEQRIYSFPFFHKKHKVIFLSSMKKLQVCVSKSYWEKRLLQERHKFDKREPVSEY
jgi:hypothetical protein